MIVADSKKILKAASHPLSPERVSQPALHTQAQDGTIGIFITIYLFTFKIFI